MPTYTTIKVENQFKRIRKPESIDYLNNTINPNHCRSAEWIDLSLAPRYGIATFNILESAKSVIELGRKETWMDFLHEVISKMIT